MCEENKECYSEEQEEAYYELDDYVQEEAYYETGDYAPEEPYTIYEDDPYNDEEDEVFDDGRFYVDENGYKVNSRGRYVDLDGRVLPGLGRAEYFYQTNKSRARRVYSSEIDDGIDPFTVVLIVIVILLLVFS